MAEDRYRTQTLALLGLVALLVCAGSLAAATFVYDRLTSRAGPDAAATPAGSQALSEQGLLVTAVVPGSPAAAALQRGDILLQAGERPLRTPRDLQLALAASQPTGSLSLTLLRGSATLVLAIPLTPADPGLGVELLAPREAAFAPPASPSPPPAAPAGASGRPAVLRTIPGSPAAAADLLAGDVITAVDGSAVLNSAELIHLIQRYRPGDSVTLTLRRGPETLSRTLQLAAAPDTADRPYLGIELVSTP